MRASTRFHRSILMIALAILAIGIIASLTSVSALAAAARQEGAQPNTGPEDDICYTTSLVSRAHSANKVFEPIWDVATIVGELNGCPDPIVEGEISFYICADNTLPFQPPHQGGCPPPYGTLVGTVTVSGDGDYTSPEYIPQKNGWYCFRSEFEPLPGNVFPAAWETNMQIIGEHAECVLIQDPNSVTLVGMAAVRQAVPLALPVIAGVTLVGLGGLWFWRKQR